MTPGVCLGSPAGGLKAGEENRKLGRGACLGQSRQVSCLRDVREPVCSRVGGVLTVPAEAQSTVGVLEEASEVGGAETGTGIVG